MLIGQYEHTLDNKGRLTLPAEYNAELAGGIVVTRGLEECLYLFPRGEFERLGDRLRELSLTNSTARKLRRWLFPQAHPAEPDRQRRIVIPQWLREAAGITDKVLIAGVDTYIELWNPEHWRNQDQNLRAELIDEDFFASLNV
jgi:MraZ protein